MEKETLEILIRNADFNKEDNSFLIVGKDFKKLAQKLNDLFALREVMHRRELLIDFLEKLENIEGVKIPLKTALTFVDEYQKGNL